MHPRHPEMHIAIDSYLLILSLELKFFVCRHVSKIVSVCPYHEKKNYPSLVNNLNIRPTVENDTSMERSSRVLPHENSKILIFFS